jgi:hypothetical protein
MPGKAAEDGEYQIACMCCQLIDEDDTFTIAKVIDYLYVYN